MVNEPSTSSTVLYHINPIKHHKSVLFYKRRHYLEPNEYYASHCQNISNNQYCGEWIHFHFPFFVSSEGEPSKNQFFPRKVGPVWENYTLQRKKPEFMLFSYLKLAENWGIALFLEKRVGAFITAGALLGLM